MVFRDSLARREISRMGILSLNAHRRITLENPNADPIRIHPKTWR